MNDLSRSSPPERLGEEIYGLIEEMFPICRSITGNGVRETLEILRKHIPLEVREVASGTAVFDWAVPKEWNIRDAYIRSPEGKKIAEFKKSNLHVLNYSIPVRGIFRLEDLKPHLYSLPEHPDWIPYRTSYYKEQWGFCLAHNDLLTMGDGEYEVLVDSTLKDGHLTYGEYFIQGKARDEVLVSSHICHPSLANDNLAGVALSTFFAQFLEKTRPAYSWRFLFIPGTIGAITWLALNPDVIPRIKHGLVLSGGGDSGEFTYKKSRRGNAQVDRIMAYVLGRLLGECKVEEFSPYGYDERQYCSPGFNLPVGRLSRTPFGQYPQYHTSADNLDFVKPQNLVETYSILLAFHQVLEGNRTLLNTNPKCEPQLGRRGIYETIGGSLDAETEKMAILWVLNLSDGEHSLLDIAERSGLNFMCILKTAEILEKSGLLTVK